MKAFRSPPSAYLCILQGKGHIIRVNSTRINGKCRNNEFAHCAADSVFLLVIDMSRKSHTFFFFFLNYCKTGTSWRGRANKSPAVALRVRCVCLIRLSVTRRRWYSTVAPDCTDLATHTGRFPHLVLGTRLCPLWVPAHSSASTSLSSSPAASRQLYTCKKIWMQRGDPVPWIWPIAPPYLTNPKMNRNAWVYLGEFQN